MRLIIVGALVCGAAVGACSHDSHTALGGNAERGRLLLRQYGCGDCHRIPDVVAANGTTGPPLAGVRQRVYLAGVVPNSPENMVRWIRSPQSFKPKTTMPDMRVPEQHAIDMVEHLFRLR